MFINVLYDTNTGMNCRVMGPYKTLRDAQDPAGVPEDVADTGCWTPIELTKVDDEGYDPAGTFVVFSGNITREKWTFFGPFRDGKAAREYVDEVYGFGPNLIIELMPVPAKEPA
jgi:hypothetical protein